MIGAILRAQLLSMRLSRGSGWVRFIPYAIWYLFWLGASVAAFFLLQVARTQDVVKYLPLAFLGVCVYWQMMPILTASMGAGLDLKKLITYPIPHQRLYVVELLLRFTTAFEMLLVLGGVLAGFLFNSRIGGLRALPRATLAVVLLIAFNLLLSSGTRSLLDRLLNKRKIRELVVLLTMCIWMVPRLLVQLNIKPKWLGPALDLVRGSGLPWSAAATMFPGAAFLVPAVALCFWTFLAYWFGRSQFERILRFDAGAAQARTTRPESSRSRSITDLFFRLPGTLWRDPLGGLVEKELRSLARTPRFRMVFVMGFTFGVIVWLPMAINKGAARPGFMSHYFLVFVCLYALTLIGQVTYWNCFGFDRSAVVFYFAAPQPMRLVLISKNLAAMTYLLVDIVILNVVVGLLHLIDGWQQAVETLIVVVTCSLYLLALGNMASVNYPRAINPERVSHGGGGGKVQGMLILFYPLALLPVVLAYVARYAFNSQIAFDAVLVLAVVIGGIVYWLGLSSAVESADRKREKLIVELSKNDGPIVAE